MLYLTKQQVGELIRHSQSESPCEACGILAGEAGCGKDAGLRRVTRIYRMANTDRSGQAFFMDSREQLKVMKELRALGLQMLGIYHSHPQTEAYPSAHDVELAYYPQASYVIISLKDRDNPRIRVFRIIEGRIEEEELVQR